LLFEVLNNPLAIRKKIVKKPTIAKKSVPLQEPEQPLMN